MRVKLEDYHGNDVLELNFPNTRLEGIIAIESHASEFDFNVADVDEDENGEYIRIQYNTEDRKDFYEILKCLVNKLIDNYL